jgi:hypothetical protein
MAKPKKQSKKQKKKATTARGKAHKAKAAKRTVAKAKAKRAPVKKTARQIKQPVVAAVETVAVEVIEQPLGVTEDDETPE